MTTGIVTLHRVLKAPPMRVYRAFIEADALAKWLPPHGFTCRVEHLEASVGGTFRMAFFHFGSGHSHAFGGEYLELVPGELIDMQLVDGPFRQLAGSWRFYPLGEFGCKIVFELRYDFSSRLLETVIGPVFGRIMTSLVDAFIEEADRVYGDD